MQHRNCILRSVQYFCQDSYEVTGTVGRGLILKTGLVPGNGFEGLQQGRGDIAILAQNRNRHAAISPCRIEASTDSKLPWYREMASRDCNRVVAISPCRIETSTGLRRYRLLGSKLQQACGDIALWVQNSTGLCLTLGAAPKLHFTQYTIFLPGSV